MNILQIILILLVAFLAVFWEAAFPATSRWLNAQVDLLPALMVYASLRLGLPAIALLALCGGLFFDSLSANPLGISIVPLFAVGLAIFWRRNDSARSTLCPICARAGPAPPPLLRCCCTAGHQPLLGWGSLWQWLVMSLGGAIATPFFFLLFGWFERALSNDHVREASFRPDREIRRGRS
jgi:hypothetical protein